jgi:hypothetical protein
MPDYTYAGVFIEEPNVGIRSIRGVETAIPVFVGLAKRGPDPTDTPWFVHGWEQFERLFGSLDSGYMLGYAVHAFFSIAGEGENKCVVKRHGLETMQQAELETTGGAAAFSSSTAFTIYARSQNEDQNNYVFSVGTSSRQIASEFKLTVQDVIAGVTSIVEVWDNLSPTSSSDNYLLRKIGQADQYVSDNIYIGAGTIATGGAAAKPAYTYYSSTAWGQTGSYSDTSLALNDLATTSLGGLGGIPEVTILATPDHTTTADMLDSFAFCETDPLF